MGLQSCISEDQKYQGKLYREKKPKGQHQKKDSAHQDNSQALVPRSAHVEDAPDAETGAVAIVDAPPRAPSPPPAARSLGYEEKAALPPVNVFDFLDPSATPNASHVDESRMIEDSVPPAYEEHPSATLADPMKFQVHDENHYSQNGFAYGSGAVMPTQEQPDPNFTTPAPKSKHSRTKSRDKDVDTTTKKSDRKRKRNSPSELDMSAIRAHQDRDVMMSDAPPVLHSGLTGGLNRLLTGPQFPPSPELSGDYAENSPLSPMKRAKQGTSKALMRAQREWEVQQEKERKAAAREEMKEQKEKERGRGRERKERKVSTALVKIKPKKRRDDSARGTRRREGDRRKRQYSSSLSPGPDRRTMKAIEYHRSGSQSPAPEQNGALIVRGNGELAPVLTGAEARAQHFLSFINKGPDSERGMSVNKALKRYHRERYDRVDRELSKAEEEKELWKSLRLKKNDRGEIVMFFAAEES
jgi:cell growth-regulating nucleolar protein